MILHLSQIFLTLALTFISLGLPPPGRMQIWVGNLFETPRRLKVEQARLRHACALSRLTQGGIIPADLPLALGPVPQSIYALNP